MKLWKALGVAGLAGVAATGVIIARNERRRAQIGPDEVRDRLRQRLEAAGAEPGPLAAQGTPAARSTPPGRSTRRWVRRRKRPRHAG